MKRATKVSCNKRKTVTDFNPRPREEGDVDFKNLLVNVIISIHALVKRATRFCHAAFMLLTISIHALVKRATGLGIKVSAINLYFNPRPREEGDRNALLSCPVRDDFNPRPREEGDRGAFFINGDENDFNPRPREEGDDTVRYAVPVLLYFNPRPREEGDSETFNTLSIRFSISIHALVKRATRFNRHMTCQRNDFNPRPREEGD